MGQHAGDELAGMKLYAFAMREKAWPVDKHWENLTRAERKAWCADAEYISNGSDEAYEMQTDLPRRCDYVGHHDD